MIKIVPIEEKTILFINNISQYSSINKRLENLVYELKQSEKNFRTLFDTASDGIILYDESSDKILRINDTLFKSMNRSFSLAFPVNTSS